MAIGALTVYLAWWLVAFGLRVLVQWRRTGDTGLRAGSAVRSAHGWVAILLSLGLLLGVTAPVAALAGLEPLPALEHHFVQGVGTILAVLGVAATLAAQLSMGASWRIGVDENERTALVTGGVFALCRNPIYTAMVTAVAGLTAMVPNPLALSGLVLTFVAIELQVRMVEEPYLLRVHGDAYARYAASVGRFVPVIGRSP